ncbi:MAG: hypothetical protein HFI46_10520 [Lachnospiraceae bacterium]|nr:hypothetical protein [Lachnospiraceae bacterium]
MSKMFRHAAGAVFLILLAEIFIFNYRHFESLFHEEITDYGLIVSDALIRQKDGSYLVGEGEAYLEFTQIDRRLDTLFFDVEPEGREEETYEPVSLNQWARDESHEEYYGIPARQIWHGQKRSQYLTYHFYGLCKSLRLSLGLRPGERIRLRFALNPVIPLFFSWYRVLFLLILFAFLYGFRPSSRIWRVPFLELKAGRKAAFIGFLVGNFLFLQVISGLNPFFQQESVVHQQQYQSLARAFANGQLSLLEEPGEALKGMENPYDLGHRHRVLGEAGEDYRWDHAYYEGKYYVYFGVVPVVLFYLPYYLLTGEDLHNRPVILIGAFLVLAGIMGLVLQIIRRWFPKTSAGAWFLLTELVVLCSNLIYMCKRTDLYTVPIIMGLGFGLLGLWHFQCARREDGSYETGKIAMGSFLLALVAGCRPQLFLLAAPGAVILGKDFFAPSRLRTRQGLCRLAALALPMAAVALPLMCYNFARFGSVFDFGANYNLCFNDMRRRGFVWDRIPLGIWAYLFAPVKTVLDFPFVEANYFNPSYLGVTITEATYGGLFAVSPFFLTVPVRFLAGKRFRCGSAFALAAASLAAGFVILLADTEMSGILMRYFSDFAIFFGIAALLSWLALYDQAGSGTARRLMRLFLVVCLLAAAVYQSCIFFLDTGEALMDLRRDLFSFAKYQVMFWL